MSAPGQWSKETVPSTIITETWRKVSLEVEDSEPLLSRAEPALEASNESLSIGSFSYRRRSGENSRLQRQVACCRYTRRGSTQPTTRMKGDGVCLLRKCRASQSQPRRLRSPPSSRSPGPCPFVGWKAHSLMTRGLCAAAAALHGVVDGEVK